MTERLKKDGTPHKKPGPKKGDPRCRENGLIGGRMVVEKYGQEFFSSIGKLGGIETHNRYGHDHYSEIGKRGGTSLRDARGPEYFRGIGKRELR